MSYVNKTDCSEDYGFVLDMENAQSLQEFIRILSRSSSLRSKKDLKILHKTLRSLPFFNKFFKEMSEDLCDSLLRELKHKYFPRAHNIFQAGTQETHLYVILKGSVYFLKPLGYTEKILSNSLTDHQLSTFRSKLSIKNGAETIAHLNASIGYLIQNDEIDNKNILSKEELHCEYLQHRLVKIKKEMELFGSNSLQFPTYRCLTAVCREACHVITISLSSFHKLLLDNKRKVEQGEIDFYKSFSLMTDWHNEDIQLLKSCSKAQTIKRNQIIYNIGDPVESIYLIKNGEIEMIQEKNTDITGEEFFMQTAKNTHASETEKPKLFEMNAIWAKQFSRARKQKIKIALLGPGQSFGEEEVFARASKRKSKVVVKSPTAELIVVSVKDFIEYGHIGRFNRPHSLGIKNKWRQNLETNVMETNQMSKIKARENKSTEQKIDLAEIPKLFIKKEDRFDPHRNRPEPPNSNSPVKIKLRPGEEIDPFNEIMMNPLRRRLQTPNRLHRSPPKSQVGSPRLINTERNTANGGTIASVGESSGTSRAKILRSAARPRSRHETNYSPIKIDSPRTSMLEGSSPSMISLQRSPSYLSFAQKISPNNRRTQSTQFDTFKILPVKDTLTDIRSPDETPTASQPSTRRLRISASEVNSQNLVNCQNPSRDEFIRIKRNSRVLSISNSKGIFDKGISPLTIHTTQTTLQSPANNYGSAVFFKSEIKPTTSRNRTPENNTARSKTWKEPINFAQASSKALTITPSKSSLTSSQNNITPSKNNVIYNTKAFFPSTLFAKRPRKESNL